MLITISLPDSASGFTSDYKHCLCQHNHDSGGAISNLEDVVVEAVMLVNLIHGTQRYRDDKMLVQNFTVQHTLVKKGAPYPWQPAQTKTAHKHSSQKVIPK